MNQRSIPVVLAVIFLLAGCSPEHASTNLEERSVNDYTIVPGERVGLITADKSSREEVLASYGDSARVDTIYLGEGIAEEGVVIFPDNSRNRMEIYWDPAIDPVRPALIRIRGAGGTDWKTVNGISIGSSIEEVEQINGRPFDLYGFGWDFGGLVTDWKGGTLENGLGLRFELQSGQAIPDDILGATIISSENEAMRQLQPVVTVIELNFPRNSLLPLMQGRWRSMADAGYQIEIEGEKIRHYNGGELTAENDIEADPDCQSNACTVTGDQPEGFCFIEKGQFDAQCMLVLACDGQRLEYTAIGSTGQPLVFRKVEKAAVQ